MIITYLQDIFQFDEFLTIIVWDSISEYRYNWTYSIKYTF